MKKQTTSVLSKLILFVVMLFLTTKIEAQEMNLNVTLSDAAQGSTIAFDGLAFLSGDFCSSTFFPPGKVSDFFGFQYLRDNDATKMGHNTDFLTRVANNMLYVLTSSQKTQLTALAKAQVTQINNYAYQRFPLIKAFNRLLQKSMPLGSTGLDRKAVIDYSAQLYMLDGQISIVRARLFGGIIKALTTTQKRYLDSLGKMGVKYWPSLTDQINKTGLTNNEFVAVMTYASEMYAWYRGNQASDVYFCPERQGNYFGGFYIKDAPAMGNPNYYIDTNLTKNSGNNFIAALTTAQAKYITSLVDTQRADLAGIVTQRTNISKLLRGYLTNTTIDTVSVMNLIKRYGELDGEISYNLATNFCKVGWTLTAAQKTTLTKIRNLSSYPCSGAYLYSDKIALPTIAITDFLFNKPAKRINESEENISRFDLSNYPNPFSQETLITYTLPEPNNVQLKLYDISGREIITLINQHQPAGTYTIPISSDRISLTEGTYFYRLTAGEFTETKIMILAK